MIRKGDVQWWILETRKHPEAAQVAIQVLAKRITELDAENEHLRNELLRARQRGSTEADSGQVKMLRAKIEKLEYLLKSQAPAEPMLVLLSEELDQARIPLSTVHDMSKAEQIPLNSRALLSLRALVVARPHDELLYITNQGRGFKQLVPDIPPLIENGRWPETTDNPLADGEQLSVAISVDRAPRFWTIATRKGYVQRFVRAALEREMNTGDPLLQSLLDRDEATAVVNGDRGDLLVLTRWGQANRFAHRTIEVQGSIALDLEPGDEVVDALTLSGDREVLIVASDGRVMRRDTMQLPARSKPGDTTGKGLIQNQDTKAIFEYHPHDWLLFLTASGQLHVASTTDIPLLDRLGKGTQVCDLEHDPAIAVTLIPKDLA